MDKDNKNTEHDNTDKKLHISDVIDSKIIRDYIDKLKEKIFKIESNMPEFWQHEYLKEIQVLYRTINELKNLIGDTSDDNELDNIKDWLKYHSRSV